jgi:hypothetical protein
MFKKNKSLKEFINVLSRRIIAKKEEYTLNQLSMSSARTSLDSGGSCLVFNNMYIRPYLQSSETY